jgi:MFS family permease
MKTQDSAVAARPPSVLRTRNVQLLVGGQALSNIGTFAQMVAQSLLVLDLTNSSFDLGVVMAAQFLPVLLFGPWAGVILDRVQVRRVLIAASVVAGVEAGVLGVVTQWGHVTMAWLIGLSLVLGLVQIFDRPAAQAMLNELVPPEQLGGAVGVMGAAQSFGRLGGPAIAGLLYAWQGAGPVFLVNAASYLAVVIAMLCLRRSQMLERTRQSRGRGQLREGFRFAWRSPLHRTTLLGNALIGLLAINFPQFYSSLVKLTFHAPSAVFAWAETLNAITAVAVGLLLSRWMRPPTTRTFAMACVLLGISLGWSAIAPTPALFLAGMPYFGVAVVYYLTISQSLVQGATPGALVGRVMSLFTLGIMGTTPVGGLLVGWITDAVSPRAAIGLGAASLFLVALVVTVAHRPPLGGTDVPHDGVLQPSAEVEPPALAAELPDGSPRREGTDERRRRRELRSPAEARSKR